MQHIRFSYELFLSDCCFLFMEIQCCIAREKFFHFPLSLLHLNANRTKMRTIFKGKHFKNGKIERGGGASPTKVSLLLSFRRICLPKEDFYFYLHISNQSCPKYENIEMSSVDCKYISNKFDIYNIRRKKIGAT